MFWENFFTILFYHFKFTDPKTLSAIGVCYCISVFFIIAMILYLLIFYFLNVLEVARAFTQKQFQLHTITIYFPTLIDVIHSYGDWIRYGLVLFMLIFSLVLCLVGQFEGLPKDLTDNDGGGMFFNVIGIVGLYVGVILSLMYNLLTILADIYGAFMTYRGYYLTRYLEWIKFDQIENLKRSKWYFWVRQIPPRNIRENFSCSTFIAWYFTHSWVPFVLLICPIWFLWTSVAVRTPNGAITFFFFLPYILFIAHALREQRLQVMKFLDRDEDGISDAVNSTSKLRNIVGVVFLVVLVVILSLVYLVMTISVDGFAKLSLSKNPGIYPVCGMGWQNPFHSKETNAAKIDSIDASIFAYIAYDESEVLMKNSLIGYLGDSFCSDPTNTKSPCSASQWRLVHAKFDENPVFFHLKQPGTGFHILSVRGTASVRDALMDLVLWSEISSLQFVGTIFPVFSIWTHDIISNIVSQTSFFQDLISKGTLQDYYEGPLNYLLENKIPLENEYLMVIGHSLGGGVAQIVGAKMYEKGSKNVVSFGLSSPGTYYSNEKFGFETDTLQFTSYTVYGERDVVPKIDEHRGVVQALDCDREIGLECHFAIQSICELAHSCYQKAGQSNLSESKSIYLTELCGVNIE